MKFIIEAHELLYDVQSMIQVFFPNQKYIKVDEIPKKGLVFISKIVENHAICQIYIDGNIHSEKSFLLKGNTREDIRVGVKTTLFLALLEYTKYKPPWGLLTGIKPAKLMRLALEEGRSQDDIIEYYKNVYFIEEDKIQLGLTVARREIDLIKTWDISQPSLYIHIPFCPSRCSYCSFTAYTTKTMGHKIDAYIDTLLYEMTKIKDLIKTPHTVYIGGGTPTSLSERQLERLLSQIEMLVDIENVAEFCVEAGRPDTITKEKLEIMKRYHVNRLSINPQTMHEETLQKIGRAHSVQSFFDAYHLAESMGFKNINIDLIVGLPDETLDHVKYTVKMLEELSLSSVTVHTLSVKRASAMAENMALGFASAKEVEEMHEYIKKSLENRGVYPYYMYRQKNMIGNLENVGYAKEGKEGLYNIVQMEEVSSVVAVGAGAVSKKVYPSEDVKRAGDTKRAFSVMPLEEYINRIDEMIQRKFDIFT